MTWELEGTAIRARGSASTRINSTAQHSTAQHWLPPSPLIRILRLSTERLDEIPVPPQAAPRPRCRLPAASLLPPRPSTRARPNLQAPAQDAALAQATRAVPHLQV